MMDLNLVVIAGRIAVPPVLTVHDPDETTLKFSVTVRSEDGHRVDVIPITLYNPATDEPMMDAVMGTNVWIAAAIQRRFVNEPILEIVAMEVQIRDEPVELSLVSDEE